MTPADLQLALNARGITINPHGGRLLLRGPNSTLTRELRAAVESMKTEMIEFLLCSRVARLEQVEAETRREYAVLDEIGERLGTDHPAYEEQRVRCEARLQEYNALNDLLFAR